MNNSPIGIFDSGIGGLTVFSKLIKKLPEENYIYFGDTKNLPYGSKSKEELISLTKNIFDFYAKQKAKAVIMACNTTSAVTYDVLKNDYDFKIYPVIQIASKYIAEKGFKRTGVLATEATANSNAYKSEIQKHNPNIQVFEQGCPGWVQIVENKTSNQPESIALVENYLKQITSKEVETIILGCTHYPYLKNILNKFENDSIFIDPADSFVDYICNDPSEGNLLCKQKRFEPKFLVSAAPENFKKSAELFYKIEQTPHLINPTATREISYML